MNTVGKAMNIGHLCSFVDDFEHAQLLIVSPGPFEWILRVPRYGRAVSAGLQLLANLTLTLYERYRLPID